MRRATYYRPTCLLLLLTQLACATAPRPVASPQTYLQAHKPKQIWVTLTNGDRMTIHAPRVYGDTLLGFTRNGTGREEVWLPMGNLQEIRTRQVSGSKTALVVGLAGVALAAIVTFLKGGGANSNRCNNEGEPCENS